MSQEDLGTPILETDLEAGDLLYLPRGTIHQVQIATFFVAVIYVNFILFCLFSFKDW